MGEFDWMSFEEGRVRFAGVEGGREGKARYVFSVELPHKRPYFGEFTPVFESDRDHFSIEVVSFGYVDAENVDRQEPRFRVVFSVEDATKIQSLFCKLVLAEGIKPMPLCSSMWPSFRKKIIFREGWIRAE